MNRHIQTIAKFVRIGQVVKFANTQNTPIFKVRCEGMNLDDKLLMYFPKKRDWWCLNDTGHELKIGDIVVIKNTVGKKFSPNIYTKVSKHLFGVDYAFCPIKQQPCRGTDYIDVEAREAEKLKRDAVPLLENVFPIETADES